TGTASDETSVDARAFAHTLRQGTLGERSSREEPVVFERFKREPEGSGRTTTEPGATAPNGRTAVAERPTEAETTAMERDRGQTRTRDEREAQREDREATRRQAPA